MKKRKPNFRLTHLSDALLPLALLAAALLGRATPALRLYVGVLIVDLLSLSAGRSLRIAFARQPSIRQVRGSVKSAITAQIGAAAVGWAAAVLLYPGFNGEWLGEPLRLAALPGLFLNIEHTFYEYLFAAGDSRSAGLCRFITSVLVLAGLVMAFPQGETAWNPTLLDWLLPGLTALAAIVAMIVALAMGGGLKGRWNDALFRCAPRAMLQSALYPAAAGLVLWQLFPGGNAVPGFFGGLMLWELCRTPFRRSPMESRPLNVSLLLILAVACAAWIALTSYFKIYAYPDVVPMACVMVAVAAICGFAVYGNIILIST